MTQHIAADLSAPSVFQNMQSALVAPAKKAQTSAATSTGTDTSATGASGIGTTFLNLLIQELQNQDPTAPMDSTAMVGQMISLNQLDQLISIDQKVAQPAASTATSSGSPATGASSGAMPFLGAPLGSAVASGSPLSLASPGSSNATSMAERMTGTPPSLSNFVDLFPFGSGGPVSPGEPVFGGVNPQPLPINRFDSGRPTSNGIPGGR